MLGALLLPAAVFGAAMMLDTSALPKRLASSVGAPVASCFLCILPAAILLVSARELLAGRYRRELLRRQGLGPRPEAAFPAVPGRRVVMVYATHHRLGPEVIWVVLDPQPVPRGRLLQALRSGMTRNSPMLRSGEAEPSATATILAALLSAIAGRSGRVIDVGRDTIFCRISVHAAGAPVRRLHGTVSTDRGTPTPAAVVAKAILSAELEQLPASPTS